MSDSVNHPDHYNSHPSGVECIQIAEHYGFCIGNAIKYLWRAGLKGDAVEDLKKARWYIERELHRRMAAATVNACRTMQLPPAPTADRTPPDAADQSPAAPAWQSFAGHTHAQPQAVRG